MAVSAAVSVAAVLCLTALAVGSDEPMSRADRVRAVAAGLRCPECAGQSVADSQTETAKAMRLVIEDLLRAGRTPDEIQSWFARRYGDEVLLAPPMRGFGVVAWCLPGVFALLGMVAWMRFTWNRSPTRTWRRPRDESMLDRRRNRHVAQ